MIGGYIYNDETNTPLRELYLMDAEIVCITPRVIAKIGKISEVTDGVESYW